MKILILGGSGLVGSTLAQSLKTENEIHVTFNTHNIDENFSKTQMNLLNDYEKLDNLIDEFEPNVIVNTIAYPNVDFCETHQKDANYLHVEIVKKLIVKCNKMKIKQIYLSTDAVFDGNLDDISKYVESDLPNPLSYYGKTKLHAENCLLYPNSNHVVLRTTVIYGWHEKSRFTNWVLKKLENNEEIPGFIDQKNTPTLVDDLVIAIKKIIEKNISGLFHATGNSCLSRYDFARLLAQKFDFSENLVKPVISKNTQAAPRPVNGCLSSELLENTINFKFSKIENGINFMLNKKNIS